MSIRRCLVGLVVALVLMLLTSSTLAGIIVSDDFEDGSIDSSKWVVGGRRWSWTPSDQGQWTYSQVEAGGYLQLNVNGPYTDNSCGATSWIRANYDFKDSSGLSMVRALVMEQVMLS
jgi:hypothetical protein